MDPSWTFASTRSDGGVTVDAIDMTMPEYYPGATVRMSLEFWQEGGNHISRYEDVRRYTKYAGRASTITALNGTVHYTERVPSGAPIDHIVVALEPSTDLQNDSTIGLWVLITDQVDDETEIIDDLARIRIRATVIATLDDYSTRSGIESALGGG